MIGSVRRGEAALEEDPARYVNRIHRDDGAGIFAHIMGMAAAANSIYIGVDREPAAKCEVVRWLHERLGPAGTGTLPGTSTAGTSLNRNVRPGPAGGVAADSRSKGGGKRCSSARICAAGYAFRYPTFREGYAAILAEEAED